MYRVVFLKQAFRDLKKLDRYTQVMLYSWISKNSDGCEDPRIKGKSLTGNMKGHWRFIAGNYRIACMIKDKELLIKTLNIGHRRDIYR